MLAGYGCRFSESTRFGRSRMISDGGRRFLIFALEGTMKLDEFQKAIRGKDASRLAADFLASDVVAAFASGEQYAGFKDAVIARYAGASFVAVVGTANWYYSLNPNKDFKPFNDSSDVDTVVVSQQHFMDAWEELRKYHRTRGYQLGRDVQDRLRRNGENIYAGFVSPAWIPDRSNLFRYSHEQSLNALSDKKVEFKPVKLLFFRNQTEVVDYYSRGFRIAKGKLLK